MNRNIRNLILLLLPTVVLAGWLAYVAADRADQPTMRIAVDGYDPRDLLRGHYVNFRLRLNGDGGFECACLGENPAEPLRPFSRRSECEPRPVASECPHFLSRPGRTFRYYASREQALEAERLLRLSPGSLSVLAHFDGRGEASFSDLRIESGAPPPKQPQQPQRTAPESSTRQPPQPSQSQPSQSQPSPQR